MARSGKVEKLQSMLKAMSEAWTSHLAFRKVKVEHIGPWGPVTHVVSPDCMCSAVGNSMLEACGAGLVTGNRRRGRESSALVRRGRPNTFLVWRRRG